MFIGAVSSFFIFLFPRAENNMATRHDYSKTIMEKNTMVSVFG
jgi:hypothetical protein